MQGSSDETANSGEEGSSGPGSSSGRSEASSNEAESSRASQSAGSPGSELHSDIADSEALKEDDEEEDDEDDEEDDDEDDEDDRPTVAATDRSPQKEARDSLTSDVRKRKAGEALGEVQAPPERPGMSGAGASGSMGPGLQKPKTLSFSSEATSAMVTSSSSSSLRILDTCSSSSACLEGSSEEHIDPASLSQSQHSQQQQQQGLGPEMGSSHGAPITQEPPCLTRATDFLSEAMGNELFNCRRFINPQHHHHHHHHHHEG